MKPDTPKPGNGLVLLIWVENSKAMLLLWIIFVIDVSCSSCFLVCSLQPSGHLLGNDQPLGSLVCVVFLCGFVIFLCGVLGHVWYLIVSNPDPCLLTYLNGLRFIVCW